MTVSLANVVIGDIALERRIGVRRDATAGARRLGAAGRSLRRDRRLGRPAPAPIRQAIKQRGIVDAPSPEG